MNPQALLIPDGGKVMKPDTEVEELRKLLVGVKWSHFWHDKKIIKNKIKFSARYGSFLGKPVVAVIANDKFVVVTAVPNSGMTEEGKRRLVIDPSNLKTGEQIKGIHEHLEQFGNIIFVIEELTNDQHA